MLLKEEEIILNPAQEKMIVSGWGKEISENTEIKRIYYESDGKHVQGYLAYPAEINKKLPLIIWNRGGSMDEGRIDDFLAAGMFGEIASWGYAVLASNYRDEDEFGGKDVNDVLSLFSIADELNFCDSKNAGMEGWSRGGMMTYRALTMTNRVKCAVIISGLADLFRSEKNKSGLTSVYERLFGTEDEAEFIRRKKERSAVYFTDKINKETSLLLIHGTKDEKISHEDSEEMYKLLKSAGTYCELKLIENGDHYLRKFKKETSDLRKSWFDRFLKN